MERRILRTVFGLFAVLVCLCLGVAVWAGRSLPEYTGECRVAGLQGDVKIVRDAHAIPYIYAKSVADAYLGLGYVHAQDRLWQLEFNRRAGSGTLAEWLGPPALETDKLLRTLGLRQVAEVTYRMLDGETQHALEAYAQGVNAYLDERRPLPPEFALLRGEPQRWTATDSVMFVKLMAWQLSGNWSDELWRLRLSERLSPQQLAEFAPPYPGDDAIPYARMLEVYAQLGLDPAQHASGERSHAGFHDLVSFAEGLARLAPAKIGETIGSNSWVVDGAHSATHRPLLANDPHLSLSAPSQWYLAHLVAPGLEVAGATLPAAVGVILGHNTHVAWSFTNTHPDTQDLYIEQLASGGSHYLTPDGPRAFVQRRERIKVKGGADVELTVRSTRHGPVVSDVLNADETHLTAGKVLALSWTGLRTDDTTSAFPLLAATALDAGALRTAAESYHAPTQNIVYGDTRGSIGFVAAGKIPVRHTDNELKGLLPAPGWLATYDWSGTVPFADLPS